MTELKFKYSSNFLADVSDPSLDITLFYLGWSKLATDLSLVSQSSINTLILSSGNGRTIPIKLVTNKIHNSFTPYVDTMLKLDLDVSYRDNNNYNKLVLYYRTSVDYGVDKVALISEDVRSVFNFSNKLNTISIYINLLNTQATLLGLNEVEGNQTITDNIIVVDPLNATTSNVMSNAVVSDYITKLKNNLPAWKNGAYFDSAGNYLHMKVMDANLENSLSNALIINQILNTFLSHIPGVVNNLNSTSVTDTLSAMMGKYLNDNKLDINDWTYEPILGPTSPTGLLDYHSKLLNYLNNAGDKLNELISSVEFFATSTAPAGYLKCNGAIVSRSTYNLLFARIGTTFNTGSENSTDFRLPDLRGQFLRGWTDGSAIDSGRVFGSNQLDEFKSHRHAIGNSRRNTGGGSGGDENHPLSYDADQVHLTNYEGGTETRPRNTALLACIRFGLVITDTTAPSNPTGLYEVSAGSNSITLSWNASTDNISVNGYEIYRDNVLIGYSNLLSYTDTGLNPTTMYGYKIKAKDSAGNVSGFSNSITSTTTIWSDTTAPTTNFLSVSYVDTIAPSVSLDWTAASDNVAIDGYILEVNIDNTGWYQLIDANVLTYLDTNVTAGSYYQYRVMSYDSALNYSAYSNIDYAYL